MGRKAVSRFFYCISIALTFALAGITILAGHAAVPPDTSPFFYPFLALALPVLLLTNMAATLYWIIRWRFWWIVPTMAFVFNWNFLSTVVRYSPDKAPTPSKVLTVATYNVDSFNNEGMGYTCKAIAQYMREQQADILCMQEFGLNSFFPADSVIHVLADWPYYYIPTDTIHRLQLALFSKYPITNRQLVTYGENANCSLWCDIEVDGRTIRVFNNHLQTTEVTRNKRKLEKELNQQEVSTERTEAAFYRLINGIHKNFIERARQADILHLMTDSTSYPMLVCGDFNSIPSSYTYKTVKGNRLLDGFQTCGHGYMYTFHYMKRLLRIDYVLHSPELKGVDYYSPDLEYSDHNPVIMKVGF